MEIKRDEYLNRLVKRIGNGSIKIITGLKAIYLTLSFTVIC